MAVAPVAGRGASAGAGPAALKTMDAYAQQPMQRPWDAHAGTQGLPLNTHFLPVSSTALSAQSAHQAAQGIFFRVWVSMLGLGYFRARVFSLLKYRARSGYGLSLG